MTGVQTCALPIYLKHTYSVKRKGGEAYINSLQLMVKLTLFRGLMDPLNSS